MHRTSLKQLATSSLIDRLDLLVARGRSNTAEVLAYIAEIEDRGAYAPLGYSSMFAYCMGRLRFSEHEAAKRLYAARAARRFPVLLDAVADGRLHLTAVMLLSKRLTAANVDELISAATHKSRVEIEKLLACRFPSAPVRDRVVPAKPAATDPPPPSVEHALEHVQIETPIATENTSAAAIALGTGPHAGSAVTSPPSDGAPHRPATPEPRTKVTPISSSSYNVQFTADQTTHDTLRSIQELLPGADLNHLVGRGLQLLLAELLKRKFAETDRPRASARPSENPRTIPAEVRRGVAARDGHRCTYVSPDGRRCESKNVEFDHVVPVAQGGTSTAGNVRLLCRAHNQYAARQVYGAGFIDGKLLHAREQRASASAT